MAESGSVVIVSLISPYRADRALARRIAGDIPFVEVFVDTPLGLCEARDPKGLYRLARAGQIGLHRHLGPLRGAGAAGPDHRHRGPHHGGLRPQP